MRARPVYRVALLVTLGGLAAYLFIPQSIARRDRAGLARAERIAATLRAPAGAIIGRDGTCGQLAHCSHVAGPARPVVADMTEALRTASGAEPERECWEQLGGEEPLTSCVLRARTGSGHGVAVHVDTRVRRTATGVRADGTDVKVTVN